MGKTAERREMAQRRERRGNRIVTTYEPVPEIDEAMPEIDEAIDRVFQVGVALGYAGWDVDSYIEAHLARRGHA